MISLLLLLHCQQTKQSDYSPSELKIIHFVQKHRARKDSLFLGARWSPLLPADRKNKEKLKYYPPDPSWHYEGPITAYNSPIADTIRGTKGDLRPAVKFGYFSFTRNNQEHKLQVYKILPKDNISKGFLFLGFTDKTTGKETYGAGRYIDLRENKRNHYIVDFNLAYNPYCAYNRRYSCAIPPPANYLNIPIRAGEKIYKDNH